MRRCLCDDNDATVDDNDATVDDGDATVDEGDATVSDARFPRPHNVNATPTSGHCMLRIHIHVHRKPARCTELSFARRTATCDYCEL